MTNEVKLSTAMGRAFHAALLLSENTLCAERAVSLAIESLDPKDFNVEAFLAGTVEYALGHCRHADGETASGADDFRLDLPVELRNVLELTTTLRRCFVLRALLGFSVEHCASLLDVSPLEVRASTARAMQSLASLASAKSFAPALVRDRFPQSNESLSLTWGFRWTQG